MNLMAARSIHENELTISILACDMAAISKILTRPLQSILVYYLVICRNNMKIAFKR